MGWRFRKSFSPLPGVRLTLSPRGLTTSIGTGPFRYTVGANGAALTSRIPGTGISFRQTIGGRASATPPEVPQILDPEPTPELAPSAMAADGHGEIRSAGTSELTSPGLAPFKDLLLQAQRERASLLPELREAREVDCRLRLRRDSWDHGVLLKHLFKGYHARLRERAAEAEARRQELEEQERLSRIHAHVELSDAVRGLYSRLVDAFALMARCERTWDTLSRVAADRSRTRSAASHSIERHPVRFDLGTCDLVESEWKVPHLQNANGADLYLYPGFALCHVSHEAFALVEMAELDLDGSPTGFIEEESVPSDARLVRHAWAKSNKDGSPDRRFKGNYQVPVLEYGKLVLRSGSGLNEEYMLSSWPAVSQFVATWKELKAALPEASAARAAGGRARGPGAGAAPPAP